MARDNLNWLANDASGKTIQSVFCPEPLKTFAIAVTNASTIALLEAGDASGSSNQFSGWYFSGLSQKNSNNGVLYYSFDITTPSAVMSIYKDSAGANLVAQGTGTDAGAPYAIVLGAQNSSGLTGGVTVVTGASDDASSISANTITMPCIKNRVFRVMSNTKFHLELGDGNITATIPTGATTDSSCSALYNSYTEYLIDAKNYSSIAVIRDETATAANGIVWITPLL